jgi:hypothetical protein
MVDFLDEKRNEIDARLRELRPLVDEFNRLEKAAAALAGIQGREPADAPRPRASGKASKPSARTPDRGARGSKTSGRRGRPRGSGRRGNQALELVRAKPGISIAELADQMGIKANYLYRVMPSLKAEGQVTKRDGGWHPAAK